MADRDLILALAKVVIAAAWADGEVAHDEIVELKHMLIRLRAAGRSRGVELSAQEWAQLDMYLATPVGPAERARLLVALQERIRGRRDQTLALAALRDVVSADGQVTPEESAVLAEIEEAISDVNVGLLGIMESLVGGRMQERRAGVTGAPNREEAFDDFLRNRVYYFLSQHGSDALPLEESEQRKLGLGGGLLAKVAHVDGEVTAAEVTSLAGAIRAHWTLSAEAAEFVAEVALGAVDRTYDTARMMSALAAEASVEERRRILTAAFAVAAADGDISLVEHEEIRLMSRGLNLTHQDFIQAKLAVLGR
jgi:uncharacterized tellurite resistance protein B-like protein